MTRLALALVAAIAAMPVKASIRVDRVVVDKSARTLTVLAGARPIATFVVALGRRSGRKHCEGDGRTPEGAYVVSGRKANSAYHRALRLSYPLPGDVDGAQARGCRPGGDIMIHGIRNGFGWIGRWHTIINWTRGCIAVTNPQIDLLWRLVPDGTPVEIRP